MFANSEYGVSSGRALGVIDDAIYSHYIDGQWLGIPGRRAVDPPFLSSKTRGRTCLHGRTADGCYPDSVWAHKEVRPDVHLGHAHYPEEVASEFFGSASSPAPEGVNHDRRAGDS